METVENEIHSDFDTQDYLILGDESIRPGGTILRWIVGISFIVYGITGFVINIELGDYLSIKIAMVCITSLLLLSPPSYPYLLGLVSTVWYLLREPTPGAGGYYSVYFAAFIVILMAMGRFVWMNLGENRRNPHQRFDVGSFCLLGIFIISLMGCIVMKNRFAYVRRLADILALLCAFYLGRSCLNIRQTLQLLVKGLAIGVIAFELPISVGLVVREGLHVLGKISEMRSGFEGAGLGYESGALLVIFAIAFSLVSSNISTKTKHLALWLVAAPAAIVILIYTSRTAIFLLPVVVFLNLLFSGRRRSALCLMILVLVVFLAAYTQSSAVQDWLYSFAKRVASIAGGEALRKGIWSQAIGYGRQYPLFGIGAGQYQIHSDYFVSAHNETLNIFAEHGIFAVFLYIIFWCRLIFIALKTRLSNNLAIRSVAGIFLVLLPVYFAYSQIEPMYYNRSGLLFVFIAGIFATLYSKSQAEYEVQDFEQDQQ